MSSEISVSTVSELATVVSASSTSDATQSDSSTATVVMSATLAIDPFSTTSQSTQTSDSSLEMPDPQPAGLAIDNLALIGGIVGGIVALLLIIGVIVFLVMRNRKATANPDLHDHPLQTVTPPVSSPSVSFKSNNQYDDVSDIRAAHEYDGVHDKLAR